MEAAKQEILSDYEYLEAIIIEAIDLATEMVNVETNRRQLRVLNEIRDKLSHELQMLRLETETQLQQLHSL